MRAGALPHLRARRPALGGAADAARRLRVWWRSGDLDRRLAEGTHPWMSRELALRARQLTSPRRLSGFARELESLVADARQGKHDPLACVPLRDSEIMVAADELLALAADLASADRCSARTAALVSFLLRDPCSPLYYGGARASAAGIARAARAGLQSRAN